MNSNKLNLNEQTEKLIGLTRSICSSATLTNIVADHDYCSVRFTCSGKEYTLSLFACTYNENEMTDGQGQYALL